MQAIFHRPGSQPASSVPATHTVKRTKRKIALGVLAALVVGLIALRIYLPTLIKNKANETLDKIPGYFGHIDGVGIHLWRGAYSIDGLQLLKTDGDVPVPFVDVPKIDFSIAWKDLLRGHLAGKVEIDKPKLNFVAGGSPAQQQTSIDKSWQDRVTELFPLRIARLGIKNGEIHFRNYHADPRIDIFIHKIAVVATNLTNSRKMAQTLKATINLDAVAMDDGDVHAHIVADPLAKRPTFKLEFEIKHLGLAQLNDFFKHYLAVNMKTGALSLYMEGAAKEGKFAGYVKPLLLKVDLVKIKENATIGEAIKGFVVKMVSYILKNHSKNQLASRIDITGDINNPQPNIWTAVSSFLGNWIVRAIAPGLEGKVTLKDAQKQQVPASPKR